MASFIPSDDDHSHIGPSYLIRKNPDGTETRIPVQVDLSSFRFHLHTNDPPDNLLAAMSSDDAVDATAYSTTQLNSGSITSGKIISPAMVRTISGLPDGAPLVTPAQEGQMAANGRYGKETCPYAPGTPEFDQWQRAWCEEEYLHQCATGKVHSRHVVNTKIVYDDVFPPDRREALIQEQADDEYWADLDAHYVNVSLEAYIDRRLSEEVAKRQEEFYRNWLVGEPPAVSWVGYSNPLDVKNFPPNM